MTGMVFNTWLGVFCDTAEEVDAANRDALELYGTMPEYLYPGAVIHPARGRNVARVAGPFPGTRPRVGRRTCAVPLRDRFRPSGVDAPFRTLPRQRQIVQLHNSAGVVALAERMPELNIVCAHITAEWLAPLAALPNVRLDLSGANRRPAARFDGVRACGIRAGAAALGDRLHGVRPGLLRDPAGTRGSGPCHAPEDRLRKFAAASRLRRERSRIRGRAVT